MQSMEVKPLPQVEKWFKKLSKKHKEATKRLAAMVVYLGERNVELEMPQVRWDLYPGLHELRERQFGYRVYFCFHGDAIIVLLAAGDKDSQPRDIKMALARLKELSHEGL